MQRSVYHSPVYHSQSIQAWEQRWFAQQNSSLGLMQQAAWTITQQLVAQFQQKKIRNIAVWCGYGNNAGDGYYIAAFLKQAGFKVTVFSSEMGDSADLKRAYQYAQSQQVNVQLLNPSCGTSSFLMKNIISVPSTLPGIPSTNHPISFPDNFPQVS